MTTITSVFSANRNSRLRSIVLGGLIIGIVHLIIQLWFVYSVLENNPFIAVLQYVTSGATGVSAFEGGTGTALIGLLIHFLISFVIAAVYILIADQIPLLRRYAIPGAFVYGFGFWIVMNLIVLPLSAAPPIPAPTTPQIIERIIEHILVIGLPLGFLVRRNANPNQ